MKATNELTDREILQMAAQDQGHLGLLVKRYRIPLYNFVYRFVGDRETAEDIVQETFLRCLRHSHKYPAIEQVATWLYTIAGNLAKTELRRRKRWNWIPISPSDDDQPTAFYEPEANEPLPGEQTDGNRVQSLVVHAIDDLPSEFRSAVLLRDLKGLSYEEIAKITNCPVGTVKSRVNRGRLRLQKTLHGLAEEVIGSLATPV